MQKAFHHGVRLAKLCAQNMYLLRSTPQIIGCRPMKIPAFFQVLILSEQSPSPCCAFLQQRNKRLLKRHFHLIKATLLDSRALTSTTRSFRANFNRTTFCREFVY